MATTKRTATTTSDSKTDPTEAKTAEEPETKAAPEPTTTPATETPGKELPAPGDYVMTRNAGARRVGESFTFTPAPGPDAALIWSGAAVPAKKPEAAAADTPAAAAAALDD